MSSKLKKKGEKMKSEKQCLAYMHAMACSNRGMWRIDVNTLNMDLSKLGTPEEYVPNTPVDFLGIEIQNNLTSKSARTVAAS